MGFLGKKVSYFNNLQNIVFHYVGEIFGQASMKFFFANYKIIKSQFFYKKSLIHQ